MNLSYEQASLILKEIVGERSLSNASYSRYLLLSTTPIGLDGSNVNEPEDPKYVRKEIGRYSYSISNPSTNWWGSPTTNTDDQGNITGYSITLAEELHYNEAGASWGTLKYFAISSSSAKVAAGGTVTGLICVGELDEAISPTANTVTLLRPGSITITLTTN